MNFSQTDKAHIQQFLADVSKSTINELSTQDELWTLTSPEAKKLINKILALNPTDYGFRGKQLPKEPVPSDAIKIKVPTNNSSGADATYLPKKVFAALNNMAEAFCVEHPDRKLLIESGYRSPLFK